MNNLNISGHRTASGGMVIKRFLVDIFFITACAISVIALLFSLAGCKPAGNEENNLKTAEESTNDGESDTAAHEETPAVTGDGDAVNYPVNYEARYIRTDGYSDKKTYPVTVLIKSKEDLDKYYSENSGSYSFEYSPDDHENSFKKQTELYDNSFFEKKMLVLILLEEGSGSVTHRVRSATMEPGFMLNVEIERHVPEVGTDDMAEWHIILEIDRNDCPNDVNVSFFNSNAALASASGSFASLSARIPEGWRSKTESDDEVLSLSFWPEGKTGQITVRHSFEGLGVCGTGLSEEETAIAGFSAVKGTYDNSPSWSFITLKDIPLGYCCILNEADGTWDLNNEDTVNEILDSIIIDPCFSFSLTWNVNGISSYDSESGKLVKTTDATHPSDYICKCILSPENLTKICSLIRNLNIESYDDVYDPGCYSEPSQDLILRVSGRGIDKTVKAENTSVIFSSQDEKGDLFMKTCEQISEIIVSTDEWKSLPEYEFFYE